MRYYNIYVLTDPPTHDGDYAPVALWHLAGVFCLALTLASFILAGLAGASQASVGLSASAKQTFRHQSERRLNADVWFDPSPLPSDQGISCYIGGLLCGPRRLNSNSFLSTKKTKLNDCGDAQSDRYKNQQETEYGNSIGKEKANEAPARLLALLLIGGFLFCGGLLLAWIAGWWR